VIFGKVLYTIVHNNLKFVINTDHLCDCKLWIKVYDGDNMIGNHFMWLLDKNFDVVKSHWRNAVKFDWSGIKWTDTKLHFTTEVKSKIDSYFRLKAFW
jgi:hypothetical protein